MNHTETYTPRAMQLKCVALFSFSLSYEEVYYPSQDAFGEVG